MSKDKVTLTYKNRQLKIMLGKKELPLDRLIDPAIIVLSADELPSLKFEIIIDTMEIDDIEAFGRWINSEEV